MRIVRTAAQYRLRGFVATLFVVSTVLVANRMLPVQDSLAQIVGAAKAPSTDVAPNLADGGAPGDWPEFHHDAARSGLLSADTAISIGNATSLVPVASPAFTTTGAAMSSPAVFQGILYYAANIRTVITNSVGMTSTLGVSTMYAVHATSGQALWHTRFPTCGAITSTVTAYAISSPAVATGTVNGVITPQVFIGRGGNTQYVNSPGCIYDFNASTGQLIWSYAADQAVFSSPAIMNTNNGALVIIGDDADLLHAFSVNYSGPLGGTGPQVWAFDNSQDSPPPDHSAYCLPAPDLCGDAVWSSPAVGVVTVNGVPHHYAYFSIGSEDNWVERVDAIDMDTIVNGQPILVWSFWDPHPQNNNDFGNILVLRNTSGQALRVYVGADFNDMFALDAATGAMIFDFNTAAQLGLGPRSSKIRPVGTFFTYNGTTALIFASGCTPLPDEDCNGPSNGYIWSIDAMSTAISGTLLWRSQNFGNDIHASPALVNQGANAVLFILGPWAPGSPMRGDLLAIDPKTGTTVGDYPVFQRAYGAISSPVPYGNRIFVTEGYTVLGSTVVKGGLAAFTCAGCP